MQIFKRYAGAFIAAVLTTGILASAFSTQFVVAALQDVGAVIPMSTRLTMTAKDLAILQTLGLVTAACFLIGFLVAQLGVNFVGGSRTAWFVVAGASALVCTLLLMSWQLQLMPIAGARTQLGLAFQGLAGAIGGLVFATLSNKNTVK